MRITRFLPVAFAEAWPALVVLVLAATIYVATLLPGVGHSGDTAKFQFVGRYLGTSHATGYPTYIILSHFFTTLLPIGSLAYRANLLSAIFSLGTLLFLYRILRLLGVHRVISMVTVLAFGLTPTFWTYSLFAEVYSLHLLFMSAVLFFFIRWMALRQDRDFLLGCAFYALSFGNHLTSIWLLPSLVFATYSTNKRVFLDSRKVLTVASFVLLSALQYTYIFWRTLDPSTVYLEMRASSLSEFLWWVTGAQFKSAMFDFGPRALFQDRIPMFIRLWVSQYGVLLVPALLGILKNPGRLATIFLGIYFLVNLGYALEYGVPDIDPYFLPEYFVTAIFVGTGLHAMLQVVPSKMRLSLMLLALSIPAYLLLRNYGQVDQHGNSAKARESLAVLNTVRQNAVIFVPDYDTYEFLMYYRIAEGYGARNIQLVHRALDDDGLNDLKAYFDNAASIPDTSNQVDLYLAGVTDRVVATARAHGLTVTEVREGLLFRVTR